MNFSVLLKLVVCSAQLQYSVMMRGLALFIENLNSILCLKQTLMVNNTLLIQRETSVLIIGQCCCLIQSMEIINVPKEKTCQYISCCVLGTIRRNVLVKEIQHVFLKISIKERVFKGVCNTYFGTRN